MRTLDDWSGFEVPDAGTACRPAVVWVEDGSLADDVASSWTRRADLGSLARCPGPWAVALWDPARAEYLLVADPIGIQPLFWARTTTGRIVASSWLAPLVDRPDVDDSLDYEGILIEQGLNGAPGLLHRTPFRNVQRIPWGSALRIGADGSTRLTRYWDPSQHSAGPDETLTLADSADLLRERIDAAIRRLTPPSGKVGAHVSGGLDCTAVACRAQQILEASGGGLVAGYSWSPSRADVAAFAGDERELLDRVSEHLGVQVRTHGSVADSDWFWALDPARYAPSTHYWESRTLTQARADGVTTLLSGWGGDEFASFNGSTVLARLMRRGRAVTVVREATRRKVLSSPHPPSFRQLARASLAALATVAPRYDALVQRVADPAEARQVREHERALVEAWREFSPVAAEAWLDQVRAVATSGVSHQEYMIRTLGLGYLQHRTGWWYQSGRLKGIDYRYPLLDLGVVEAALRLPWWAFRWQGWNRVAFRLAIDEWVPPAVAWNMRKTDPALFGHSWAPGRATLRSPRTRVGDPTYAAVMRLVDMAWDYGTPWPESFPPTLPRPELAPAQTNVRGRPLEGRGHR